MCAQFNYYAAELNTVTATTTTGAKTKTNACICYNQLMSRYVRSSSSTSSSSSSLSHTTNKTHNREATTATETKTTPSTISLGHNLRHFCLLLIGVALVIADHCLVRVAAAPQSCVLCDVNDLQANVDRAPSASYEEFLFEHQVSRQDAINALKVLNDSFYEGPGPELSCKSVSCTKAVMKYCLSPQFINDHCWCELGHSDEGLPFIPHICYVGEKSYSPSVGSCFFYEEVKECCCAPALAKQWRHISKASNTITKPRMLLVQLLLMLPLVAGRLRVRF